MKREFSRNCSQKYKDLDADNNNVYDVPPMVTKDQAMEPPTCEVDGPTRARPRSNDDVVDGLLHNLSISSPPPNLLTQGSGGQQQRQSRRFSTISKGSSSSLLNEQLSSFDHGEMRMSLEEALKQLIALKKSVEDVVSKLLTFVHESWRQSAYFAENLPAIKLAFAEILTSVKEFLDFSHGCYSSATAAAAASEIPAHHVVNGFRRCMKPVQEDYKMLQKALAELVESGWAVESDETMANASTAAVGGGQQDMDTVGSFVMTSRAVSDDVGQMAIYIHTHAHSIFEVARAPSSNSTSRSNSTHFPTSNQQQQQQQQVQARPLPEVPSADGAEEPQHEESKEWLDDYDYVSLQDDDDTTDVKEDATNIIESINKRMSKLNALADAPLPKHQFSLSQESRSSVIKLQIDVGTLIQTLSKSIHRVLMAIEQGMAPVRFVALTKQVICAGHQLKLVAQCLLQNIESRPASEQLQSRCLAMETILRRTVSATKSVALQWPSRAATDSMTERLCDVAASAHEIRNVIIQIIPIIPV